MNKTLNYNRSLIRRHAKREIIKETKRNIAKQILLENYDKAINASMIFDIASKEDLRNIIKIVENNKAELIAIDKAFRAAIINDQFTNTNKKVNSILREHNAVNKKGVLKESWVDFGIDMFFGFAPMIADSPPMLALTGGTSMSVGRAIAFAGMLYYGGKLNVALKSDNTFDAFIHGMSLFLSLIAAFPAVGAALAGYGRTVLNMFMRIASPIWKIFSFPFKTIFTGGANIKAAAAKKAFEKGVEIASKHSGLSDDALKFFAEAGEQVIKNGGDLKVLAEIAKKGGKYVDEFEKFAPALKSALESIPMAGSKMAGLVDDILKTLKPAMEVVGPAAKGLSEVAEVTAKSNLTNVQAGALTARAAAVMEPGGVKATQEAVELLARESDEFAAAAKQLGFIDEAFETLAKTGDDIAASADDISKAGAKFGNMASGFDEIVARGIGETGKKLGPEVLDDTMKAVRSLADDAAVSFAQYGEEVAKIALARGYSSVYRSLFQGMDDISRIAGVTMKESIAAIPTAGRTLGTGRFVIDDIVMEGGKLVAKTAEGGIMQITPKMMRNKPLNTMIPKIMGTMKSAINQNTAKVAERMTRAQAQAGAKVTQVAIEGGEEVTKASLKAGGETVEEVSQELMKQADELLTPAAANSIEQQVAKQFESLEIILSPSKWIKFGEKFYYDVIAGSFRSFIDPAVTQRKSTGINEAIRLLEKRDRRQKRIKNHTSLKLLY